MKTDILSEIVAHKKNEVLIEKQKIPIDKLYKGINDTSKQRSLRHSLETSSTGIIAEFKRKSPSKGWIYQNAKAENIPQGYEKSGASALSILTDKTYFGGLSQDLISARECVSIPILRKDFTVDEYQIYQTKYWGADAILLIAAAISKKECKEFSRIAHNLQLEVLLEIHSEEELDYLNEYIDILGVNNRNLGTFITDINQSFNISTKLPKSILWVSESGIHTPEAVKQLRQVGYKGFLIGEHFMKTHQPAMELSQFIKEIEAL